MQPDSLSVAIESSPAYRTLEPGQLELVARAAEVLAASSTALTHAQLAQALRRWFSGARLEDTLEPSLERFGLFRKTAELTWKLADAATLGRPFGELPVCVLDVEATGGRPPLHRIIELGAVRIEPDGSTSTLDLLINPARPLPPFIARMTGLTQPQLEAAPRFSEVLERIEAFLHSAILVAHNVQGDIELLNYELFRHQGRLLENPIFCTMAATRALRPAIEGAGLETVANELGIEFAQLHRALDDARATASVWSELRKDLETLGARTLLDLSCFQGQIVEPQFVASRLTVERLAELPASPGVFKLLGAGGRLVHAEAAGDLRRVIQGYFYPRYKLPPYVKRMLRDTLDFSFTLCATAEEARASFAAEKVRLPSRQRRRGRRR